MKTKVVNMTKSSIVMKVGSAGAYRVLCSELKPKKAYTIKVDTHATYREYLCALTSDNDKHVVLSSDDCIENEEVHIKLKEDQYTWDAVKRGSHLLVKDSGEDSGRILYQSSSDSVPRFVGNVWMKLKGFGEDSGRILYQSSSDSVPRVIGKVWMKLKGSGEDSGRILSETSSDPGPPRRRQSVDETQGFRRGLRANSVQDVVRPRPPLRRQSVDETQGFVVRDDPKLPDDGREVPKPNGLVAGSKPGGSSFST